LWLLYILLVQLRIVENLGNLCHLFISTMVLSIVVYMVPFNGSFQIVDIFLCDFSLGCMVI